MTINERFDELIKCLFSGNKRAFAHSVGISASVVENVVGTRKGKPSFDVLEKVCANANVSPEWLLTGQGPMLRTPDVQLATPAVQKKFALSTDINIDFQQIPLYNLEATAGLVSLFNDANAAPVGYVSLPNLPSCDGAVYVRGDSMYPLLKSGDIVLYKRVRDFENGIFFGEMYLVSANVDGDEFITIKYIHKSEKEGYIKLVSHNPHHEPKDIPVSMVRALALVKASVRYNTIR